MDRTRKEIQTDPLPRSRIALLYSARFKRCAGGRPGLGAAAAAASRASSSRATNCAESAAAGAGKPAGGISPRLTFRSTFSHKAAREPTSVRSCPSKDRPAVRRVSLWQPRQCFPISNRTGSTCPAERVPCCCATARRTAMPARKRVCSTGPFYPSPIKSVGK